MFWWLYKSPYRIENPSKPWPIILWLQGGPVSTNQQSHMLNHIMFPPLKKKKPRNYELILNINVFICDETGCFRSWDWEF